ncbi:MAG: hypothetical protein AAFV51_07465 [Pseudomonadota bacterium]
MFRTLACSTVAAAIATMAAAAERTYLCNLTDIDAYAEPSAYARIDAAGRGSVRFTHASLWSIDYCAGSEPLDTDEDGADVEVIYDDCRSASGRITARRRIAVYETADGRQAPPTYVPRAIVRIAPDGDELETPRILEAGRVTLFDVTQSTGAWPGAWREDRALRFCRRVANFDQ